MKPADFLDDEPLMLKGCTGSELTFVIIATVAVWLLLSGLVSFMLWNIFAGLILFMIMTPTTVWAIAVWYSHLKRNHPRHWHLQYLAHHFYWTGYFHQCQHIGNFRATKF